MTNKKSSQNKITSAEHSAIVRRGVCPGCEDYKLQLAPRVRTDDFGNVSFGGSYYCCSSEYGHLCFHMTSSASQDKNLYATFGESAKYTKGHLKGRKGATTPAMLKAREEQPRVLRRAKKVV